MVFEHAKHPLLGSCLVPHFFPNNLSFTGPMCTILGMWPYVKKLYRCAKFQSCSFISRNFMLLKSRWGKLDKGPLLKNYLFLGDGCSGPLPAAQRSPHDWGCGGPGAHPLPGTSSPLKIKNPSGLLILPTAVLVARNILWNNIEELWNTSEKFSGQLLKTCMSQAGVGVHV